MWKDYQNYDKLGGGNSKGRREYWENWEEPGGPEKYQEDLRSTRRNRKEPGWNFSKHIILSILSKSFAYFLCWKLFDNFFPSKVILPKMLSLNKIIFYCATVEKSKDWFSLVQFFLKTRYIISLTELKWRQGCIFSKMFIPPPPHLWKIIFFP